MPEFVSLRWEAAPEGWELYGIRKDMPFYDEILMLAWVYQLHSKKKWAAIVYANEEAEGHEFDSLEDAQAWCTACVRVS